MLFFYFKTNYEVSTPISIKTDKKIFCKFILHVYINLQKSFFYIYKYSCIL